MTLNEIIAGVRARLGDLKPPYLWTDDELTEYLNEAINEVADQKKLFLETILAPMCHIPIFQADATGDYPYDPRITEVLRAKIRSQKLYLWRTDKMTLDYNNPDWRNLTPTTPRWLVTDYQTGMLTIVPKSNQDDFIDLTVYRLPLNQMNTNTPDASPEIHFKHHQRLYNGIMQRAYLKEDTQCLDPKKAEKHEGLWKVDMVEIAKSRQKFQDSYQFIQVPYGAI
jgi:hypothetical protein